MRWIRAMCAHHLRHSHQIRATRPMHSSHRFDFIMGERLIVSAQSRPNYPEMCIHFHLCFGHESKGVQLEDTNECESNPRQRGTEPLKLKEFNAWGDLVWMTSVHRRLLHVVNCLTIRSGYYYDLNPPLLLPFYVWRRSIPWRGISFADTFGHLITVCEPHALNEEEYGDCDHIREERGVYSVRKIYYSGFACKIKCAKFVSYPTSRMNFCLNYSRQMDVVYAISGRRLGISIFGWHFLLFRSFSPAQFFPLYSFFLRWEDDDDECRRAERSQKSWKFMIVNGHGHLLRPESDSSAHQKAHRMKRPPASCAVCVCTCVYDLKPGRSWEIAKKWEPQMVDDVVDENGKPKMK